MKTEITQIKLQLKNREILLSAEEARALQKELNNLFEAEKSTLEKLQEQLAELQRSQIPPCAPYPVPVPMPVYTRSIVVEPNMPWWQPHWRIYCGDSNSGTLVGQSSEPSTCGTLCMSIQQ